MKSQEKECSAAHAFRLTPCAKGKSLVGVAGAVAVGAFAFLVFGPVADQRALEMAGYLALPAAAVAVATKSGSEPMLPERLAGAVPRPFHEPH